MSLAAYLVLSGILFAIGAAIVLVRRSAVISLDGSRAHAQLRQSCLRDLRANPRKC